MKKPLLTLLLFIFMLHFAFSQTNTFPTTGNVGIGTTSPLTSIHIVGPGTSIDGISQTTGGGVIVQGNTGSRSATTGAQLEFVIPAGTDGANLWGQARIITVAGNGNTNDATGKMILGTRRYYNKLGAGQNWYYGNDVTIDGNGNVGIGTTTPDAKLVVAGSGIIQNLTNASDQDLKFSLTAVGATDKYALIAPSTATNLAFGVAGTEKIRITNAGNVGIGTTNTQGYKLAVNGSVIATAVNVKPYANWPDYVFNKKYRLPSLADVKTYIDQNHHLPDMPSEKEVAKDGINLGEMNKLLTKKVEELTLYLIEKDKQVNGQQKVIQAIQQQLNDLTSQLKASGKTLKTTRSN